MFKLLLKYMLGLTLLAMIAVAALYIIAGKIHERGAEQTMQAMHSGVFYSIQQQLQTYPSAQWPTVIKQLRPIYGVEASVIPLAEIHLPPAKMRQLQAGEFVVNTADEQYFFGYGVEEIFSYQRIAHSDYVIKMQDIPIQVIAPYVSAWMIHLITLELAQTPENQWSAKLSQLQKFYGLPLLIISEAESLPTAVISSLRNNEFALSAPNISNGQIDYLYVKIQGNTAILRIGPIPYPLYVQHQLLILLISFITIAIAFVILLTYIFSRNLQKIYKITEQYSKADFSAPPALSRHSTLRTLYENILSMGNKIQNLMKSQHNLTRFVAHECRTPVTTMLFAIESLERENLSEKAQDHIDSIKNDLADLNALVSDFLNYARFSEQEFEPHYRAVNIRQWLAACLTKYRDAPKKIDLSSDIPMDTLINFDPELMKHVVNNLINNALKHAGSQIKVIAELQHSSCVLHIDDDGAAIEDGEKANIFAPFVRLESNESGFGLGLYIAESIVKRHRGSIQVSNSPLGGARFSVFLPI